MNRLWKWTSAAPCYNSSFHTRPLRDLFPGRSGLLTAITLYPCPPVQEAVRGARRRRRVCPGAAESASGSTCGWASASCPWAAETELLWSRRSTCSSTRWDADTHYTKPNFSQCLDMSTCLCTFMHALLHRPVWNETMRCFTLKVLHPDWVNLITVPPGLSKNWE